MFRNFKITLFTALNDGYDEGLYGVQYSDRKYFWETALLQTEIE
jgi:hypothetical protein